MPWSNAETSAERRAELVERIGRLRLLISADPDRELREELERLRDELRVLDSNNRNGGATMA